MQPASTVPAELGLIAVHRAPVHARVNLLVPHQLSNLPLHACVQEEGVPYNGHPPKKLTTELTSSASLFITMGCGEACPYAPGLEVQDWCGACMPGVLHSRRPGHCASACARQRSNRGPSVMPLNGPTRHSACSLAMIAAPSACAWDSPLGLQLHARIVCGLLPFVWPCVLCCRQIPDPHGGDLVRAVLPHGSMSIGILPCVACAAGDTALVDIASQVAAVSMQ